MTHINAALTGVFDATAGRLAAASPWLGLVVISLVSGVVLVLIFRYTSSQRGIRAAKDRIVSHLLEVVLYRDELAVVLRAQVAVARDNLRYLAYALVPLAFMVVPVGLLLIQTDLRYGHRPLAVGEPVIVAVKLRPDAGSVDDVVITAPPGLVVETPAMRIRGASEVDWRLRAAAPGIHELQFTAGDQQFAKQVVVGRLGARVAARRVRVGLRAQATHPGESPLPATGSVEWVEVSYPPASLRLLRWRLHWIWPWLILSMAFGYALKGPLRVEV